MVKQQLFGLSFGQLADPRQLLAQAIDSRILLLNDVSG